LFVDIGGVLLTNGWDLAARQRAVAAFHLDGPAYEELHQQAFSVHEEGRLSLDDYLDRAVFCKRRPFTRDQFRRFMFSQSQPCPGMMGMMSALKRRHRLKIAVLSNEGRELNAHRIRAFKLDALADLFVSSCFVGLRKPDPALFRLAVDLAQTPVERIVYLENTPMFVRAAKMQGIRSILHKDLGSTRAALSAAGLD
jgi:putative hydrolase of the HAD superfamily